MLQLFVLEDSGTGKDAGPTLPLLRQFLPSQIIELVPLAVAPSGTGPDVEHIASEIRDRLSLRRRSLVAGEAQQDNVLVHCAFLFSVDQADTSSRSDPDGARRLERVILTNDAI